MSQCAVKGCTSAAWKLRCDAFQVDAACGPADGRQHWHRVPDGAWADFCRPTGGRMPAVAFICSRHFLPKDYTTSQRSRARSMRKPRLLPAAEPTQNSPDSFGPQLRRPPKLVLGRAGRGSYRPRGHGLARRSFLLSVTADDEPQMDPAERARIVQEAMEEYEHREETYWKPAVDYARRRYSNVDSLDSPDAKAWRIHTYPVTRSATSSLTGEESPVEADEPVRNGHWLADLASADTELPGETPTGPSPASEPIGNGVTPSQTTESPIAEQRVTPNVKIKEEDEGGLGADSEAVVSLLDSCDSDAGDGGGGSASSPGGEEALERADGDSEDPSDPAQAAPADSLVTMWPFVQVVDGTSDSAAEQPCQTEETERTAVPSPRRVITVRPTRYRGGRVQYVPNPAVSGSESTGPRRSSRTVTVQRGPAAVVHMKVVRPSPVTHVKVVRPSAADDAEVKRLQEELDWLRRQLADGNRQVRVWRGLLSREASRLAAPCSSDVDEEPQGSPTLDGEDQPMASDDSENDDTEMPAPSPTSVTCTFPLNKFPVLPAERSAAEAAHRQAIRQMARLQVSAMRDKLALRRAQLRLLEHRLEAKLARQRRRRRLASLLTPAQCCALEGSAPQCWPKEDVQRAVQLRSACGKEGYRWLQRRWKLPLPPLFSLPVQTAEADDGAEMQGTGNGPVECADDVKTEEF